MAIFLASTKSISRGKGQSAVASASYRAGVELEDKRYGKVHNYSKRHGVVSANIILPATLADANAFIERADLWNMAEKAEKRKDARVSREWLINLPYELDETTRKELAHTFAQTLADRYGTIADCAIHKPTDKEIERGADSRNHHAHIMFTTRQAELDDQGRIKLTHKASIELSDNKRREIGLKRVSEEIKAVRQIWEQIANRKLEEFGHSLIDSRSYKEIGVSIIPQIKMGKDSTNMERNGESTNHGYRNRQIAEHNRLTWSIQMSENKRTNDKADQIIFEKQKEIDDDIIRRIEDSERRIKKANDYSKFTNGRLTRVKCRLNASKHGVRNSELQINRYEYETREITLGLSNNAEQQRWTDNTIAKCFKPRCTDSNTLRRRIIETERRTNDSKRDAFTTDRDIERLVRKTDLVIHGKAKEIALRFFRDYYILHHRGLMKLNKDDFDKRLNVRQEEILDEFSVMNNLTSDIKDDIHVYRKMVVDFFKVPENLVQHQDFINMLLNPKREEQEHSRMLSEAQQASQSSSLYKDTGSGSKTQKNVLMNLYIPRF